MTDSQPVVPVPDPQQPDISPAIPATDPQPVVPAPATPVIGPAAPSLDTDKCDSLGNPKHDSTLPGSGKGATAPDDSFTAEEKTAKQKDADAKAAAQVASTDDVDSRGMKKGAFAVTAQGYDKHGMRLPDKVDYSKPLDPPAVHGPRGHHAPKDSFQT